MQTEKVKVPQFYLATSKQVAGIAITRAYSGNWYTGYRIEPSGQILCLGNYTDPKQFLQMPVYTVEPENEDAFIAAYRLSNNLSACLDAYGKVDYRIPRNRGN